MDPETCGKTKKRRISIFRGGLFSEKRGLSSSVSLFEIQTHTHTHTHTHTPTVVPSLALSQTERLCHKHIVHCSCQIIRWLLQKNTKKERVKPSDKYSEQPCTSGFTDIKKAFIPIRSIKGRNRRTARTHSHGLAEVLSKKRQFCLMENRLTRDKANKDIPSLCGDTSAENISREENKKIRKRK